MGQIKKYETFSFVLHGREGAFLKKLQKQKDHTWLTRCIREEWFREKYGNLVSGSDDEAQLKLALGDLVELQKVRDLQNKDILSQAEKVRQLQVKVQRSKFKEEQIKKLESEVLIYGN